MINQKRLSIYFLSILVFLITLSAPAFAYWSSTSSANGTGSVKATTVNTGNTPTTTVSGSNVTVTWTASTLASGQAVTGYDITRYDTATLTAVDPVDNCAGVITTTSCTETNVPDGNWRYTVTPLIGTDWEGTESGYSTSILVDSTPPTSTLVLSNITGSASINGNTVYYNETTAGSFTITNTVTDAGSGPASSTTSTLTGTSTGWTHTPSTVTTPTGGPYVSNSFSWTAGTSTSPNETVTSTDKSGNTTTQTLKFIDNSKAPTGTITYTDGYSSGRYVTITFTSQANGAPITGTQLQRSRGSLKNDVCTNFGSFTNIGSANPTSPYTDGPFTAGACYKYQLIINDQSGNSSTITSTATTKYGYAGAVQATTGLVSYWRFGENTPTVSDSFTGTTGVALQDRTGETGATWTQHSTATADAVFTPAGRIRKEGTSTTLALDYASGTPTSADYRVSADIYSASTVTNDRIGVTGRTDTTTGTYYSAYYDQATGAYTLSSTVNGTATILGSSVQTFTAGTTHRISLDMVGTTIRVLVDGTQTISVTNSSITAVGKSGVILGSTTATTDTDTTGLQLDNFTTGPTSTTPNSTDSKGSNTGTYTNGPTLGTTGAISGDTDTAATFDGSDDYMRVASPTGLPTGATARSTEIWFKTSATTQQTLFSYGTPSNNAEYGLWLNSGGSTMTAWGYGTGNDKTFTLSSAVNNNVWHQATLVYNGTQLSLYIDGTLVSTQTATRNTSIDSYGFTVGAIITPGITGASGGYFNGSLDEVAFYNTNLTAATIADHYALAGSVQDTDGPTGGSIDGTNLVGTGTRYRNTTSLSLGFSKGTDPSGVATTGALLYRATATLSAGNCGVYGTYTLVATDPTSPLTQTVASAVCYRYKYVVPDTLGNTTTYPSPSIKVDTSVAGTPGTPSSSALTNTYRTSTKIYYRSNATSGSITLTGSATDSQSGIAYYTWPSLGSGWTQTAGATSNIVTYSWSAANPNVPGAVGFNATNNAALTGANRTITFIEDNTAPTGGAISYTDGKTTATTAPLTITLGSDAASGLGSTKTILVSTAPATGGVCGTFGAYTTLGTTTSTTSPITYNAALSTIDTCYKFGVTIPDKVGNTVTYYGTQIVRRTAVYSTLITSTTSLLDFWRLDETSGATTATDSKGGDNNGTYVGTPTLGVTGAIVGDTDTAVTFNGSSQYLTANRSAFTGNMSTEFWFNSTQTNGGTGTWSGNAAIVDADVTGAANDFGISLNSTGAITAGTGVASGTDTTLTSQTGLNDGQWHYIVFTRATTGALVLYVDGAQVATGTGSTNAPTASTTMTVGRAASGGRWYAGSVDELATHNAVLTQAQVTARYNAGK